MAALLLLALVGGRAAAQFDAFDSAGERSLLPTGVELLQHVVSRARCGAAAGAAAGHVPARAAVSAAAAHVGQLPAPPSLARAEYTRHMHAAAAPCLRHAAAFCRAAVCSTSRGRHTRRLPRTSRTACHSVYCPPPKKTPPPHHTHTQTHTQHTTEAAFDALERSLLPLADSTPDQQQQQQQQQAAPAAALCSAAADACCALSGRPQDCGASAAAARGCRSELACVPAADPCSAAANEAACAARGPFCRCAARRQRRRRRQSCVRVIACGCV
jgi:hypothetical protein